jgi:hypothetical protein
MRLGRKSLIVLVTTVTALTGAFDGCLLDCHVAAPVQDVQAAAAHCHAVTAQQAGVRWRTVPVCHHDHTSATPESTAQNRHDSRPLGIVLSFAWHPDRPVASTLPVMRSTLSRSAPTTHFIPLRV